MRVRQKIAEFLEPMFSENRQAEQSNAAEQDAVRPSSLLVAGASGSPAPAAPDAEMYMSDVKPIGYARKQDLLEYKPIVAMYDRPLAPENGYEAVKLYSEDQVNVILASRHQPAEALDAARYRYSIKNNLLPIVYYPAIHELSNGPGYVLHAIGVIGAKVLGYGKTKDAAIDAARAQPSKESGHD